MCVSSGYQLSAGIVLCLPLGWPACTWACFRMAHRKSAASFAVGVSAGSAMFLVLPIVALALEAARRVGEIPVEQVNAGSVCGLCLGMVVSVVEAASA